MDLNGFNDNKKKPQRSTTDLTPTSIIEQLLPLTSSWHQSSAAYSSTMPAIYSSFGGAGGNSYLNDAANFSLLGLQQTQQQASSSSPFYQSLANFASDFGANSNSSLLANFSTSNSLGNQMDASDSSNIFSGTTTGASSNFSSNDQQQQQQQQHNTNQVGGGGGDGRNLNHYRHNDSTSTTGAQAATAAAARTYSSVLHSRSQSGLSTLQQQQQADRLSLFDIQQQSQSLNKSSDFPLGQQDLSQMNHLAGLDPTNSRQYFNAPARLLDGFLSATSNASRQQQQQQNITFQHPQHRHQHHQMKGGPSSQYRGGASTTMSLAGPQGRSSIGDRSPSSNVANSNSMVASSNKSRRVQTGSKMGPFFSGGGGGGGSSSSSSYLGEGQLGYKLDPHGTGVVNSDETARFSRKVFVGGLPPDIDEEEIKASFRRFGALVVDWPHKAESKSYFPPKGYAFLLFQEEASVQSLIDSCFQEEDKLYLCVSSPTIKDKPVQIRPWRLSDSDFVLDSSLALDPRKTVFVGGVPRPLKASELATIMNNLYGGVCYAGIDTDPELKYPKGAGRVAFSNHQSYIAAISARFVHIHHSEIEKRVEVKPYVLDDQFCDECHGSRCNNKFAPFFCANITCLRYYCDNCWASMHAQAGKEFHKPLVKEGGDRPRGTQSSFRW